MLPVILLLVLLASAAERSEGTNAASTTPPARINGDLPWRHLAGEGAKAEFIGGAAEIRFKPFAGSMRAVLRFRCGQNRCAGDFRDPLLLVPIANFPHLRVKFRWVEGELVSTTALSRLPHGSLLSFSQSGRRHTVQMR